MLWMELGLPHVPLFARQSRVLMQHPGSLHTSKIYRFSKIWNFIKKNSHAIERKTNPSAQARNALYGHFFFESIKAQYVRTEREYFV
jgi:hypothetical protein